MPHLLQHDIRIGILARMLTESCNVCKNLVDIGQIEIAAQRKVFRPPVIAAQKRMHIRNAAPPRGGIAQMPHIKFSRKRKACLGIFGIAHLFGCQIAELRMHGAEDFGYRPRAQRTLAEHIFLSRICL